MPVSSASRATLAAAAMSKRFGCLIGRPSCRAQVFAVRRAGRSITKPARMESLLAWVQTTRLDVGPVAAIRAPTDAHGTSSSVLGLLGYKSSPGGPARGLLLGRRDGQQVIEDQPKGVHTQ